MAGINKKVLLAIAGAFLLCSVMHFFTFYMPFTIGVTQLYCECTVLIWAASIRKRITDRRLRLVLLALVWALLVFFLSQTCRYNVFWKMAGPRRYLWYFYYTPMIAFPLLLLAAALLIHRPENRPLPLWFWLVAAFGALLAAVVMANDLHFRFVSYSGPVMEDDAAVYGWLYYAVNAFIYPLYFVGYGIILRKSRATDGMLRYLPLVMLLIAVVYFALYPLNLGKRFLGVRIWNIGEMLAFCLIGALEACIQTGMIPANQSYERLFALSRIPAVILDKEDRLRYATAGTVYPFPDREALQIMSHPIIGGRIEWAADVRRLRQLGRELTEATRRIEARNAYLTAEAGVRAETVEAETRNEIYDRITQVTRSQATQIIALLDAETPDFDDRLRRIAMLSAFIKRRSNMELIAEDGILPFEELCLAAAESLRYVRLCGVNATSVCEGAGLFPASVVTDAYERIEQVLESSLEHLYDLIINLGAARDELTVRLMLRADDLVVQTEGAPLEVSGFTRQVSVTKNEQDMILVFRYTGGGAAP